MIEEICKGYRCDLDGLHGLAHWKRVEANALKIAEMGASSLQELKRYSNLLSSIRARIEQELPVVRGAFKWAGKFAAHNAVHSLSW